MAVACKLKAKYLHPVGMASTSLMCPRDKPSIIKLNDQGTVASNMAFAGLTKMVDELVRATGLPAAIAYPGLHPDSVRFLETAICTTFETEGIDNTSGLMLQ